MMITEHAVREEAVPEPVPGEGQRRQGSATSGKALQLSAALQTTLDVESVLALFAQEAAGSVPFDGLVYDNAGAQVHVEHGSPGGHSVRYALSVDGEELGELWLSRARAFQEDDLLVAEHLISALVYPLRNALLYREATLAALRDPLTGAYNRTMLERTVEREARLAQRHELPLSMVMLDLDQFKAINDTYGHLAGDRVLQNLVHCIEERVRATDLLTRYGGDEFALLLSNTPREGAEILAERLRGAIEATHRTWLPESELPITASVGLAFLEEGNGAKLIVAADDALLTAKRQGGNRVVSSPA